MEGGEHLGRRETDSFERAGLERDFVVETGVVKDHHDKRKIEQFVKKLLRCYPM